MKLNIKADDEIVHFAFESIVTETCGFSPTKDGGQAISPLKI
jgi:hypothetical protein